MTCDRIWDLLSVYADAEATREEAAMVESHIAVCSTCARDLRFMAATSGVLNLIPEIDPPTTLQASILSATVYRPTWQQRLQGLVLAGFASNAVRYGALAGAAALAFIVLRPVQSPIVIQPETNMAHSGVSAPPSFDNTRSDDTGTVKVHAEPAKANPVTISHPAIQLAHDEVRILKSGESKPVHMLQKSLAGSFTIAAVGRPEFNSKVDSTDAGTVRTSVEPVEPPSELPQNTPTIVMGGMMQPADMMESNAGDSGTTESVSREAMNSPATAHITLASETTIVPTGQMVTLADLKRSLRKATSSDHARFVQDSIKEKQIRLDVVRGRF